MEIKNCVAVVTGSGIGFGRDIALNLSQEGEDLVLADIDGDRMESVCREIQDNTFRVVTHPGSQDIMVERIQDIEGMINRVVKERAASEEQISKLLDDIRMEEAVEKKRE